MEKSGTMSEKKRVPRKTASKENFIQANAEPKKPNRGNKKLEVSPEMRHQMIAEAAYFRAELFGHGGDHFEHWLAAENEIDVMLKKNK